ncbi:MAG: hypothetical protein DMG62_11060 [Acidobacteria bacterium]|nr:MAG: hypothetical protein DMG62_11060 [Acidobacteriota bacterium]
MGNFLSGISSSPVDSVEAWPEDCGIKKETAADFSSRETATSSCRFSERKVVERIFLVKQ